MNRSEIQAHIECKRDASKHPEVCEKSLDSKHKWGFLFARETCEACGEPKSACIAIHSEEKGSKENEPEMA